MYKVIARKYRPQSFDQVVGQEHVKKTLRNALIQGRVAHGYIFSGPRGTGKTTMARILAMALNCEGGPSPTPDPQSSVCREIAEGNALDVFEIDAASNRRIDDIRELRESVKFLPARDPYKIFIIDEAHQITNDAFNALLKTLEEPPEQVVFILCTTEPQAIPATIVSRCQHFAFQTADFESVLLHLRYICNQEGIKADEDSLTAIALSSDGSIRDSLSTLDQAIAACDKKLEVEVVRQILGSIRSEVTDCILAAIRDFEPKAILKVTAELMKDGQHPQHFCRELTRQFRNLMVMKLENNDTESRLVTASKSERQSAASWLEVFSREDLIHYVQILLSLYRDMQNATQQQFHLELGLLQLVYAGQLRPIETVLSGLEEPRKSRHPGSSGSPKPTTAPASRSNSSVQPSHQPDPVLVPMSPWSGSNSFEDRLIRKLHDNDQPTLASMLSQSVLRHEGNQIKIEATKGQITLMELSIKELEKALASLMDSKPSVKFESVVSSSAASKEPAPARSVDPAAPASEASVDSTAEKRALDDPAVREIRKRFEGRVRRVHDLRKETS